MLLSQPILYVVLMAAFGVMAAPIARYSKFYGDLLATEVASSTRFPSLDGLRGVLALSVFVHHSGYFVSYYRGDGWNIPHQSMLFMVGSVGVSVFFMITGFLFWTKAIEARGRLRLMSLYISRFRRIYPMFLFSFAVILVITAVRSGGELKEPIQKTALEIGEWLSVGLAGFPVINRLNPWFVNNAGVTWTLQYETWFYILLPALAFIFWKPWRFMAMLGLALLLLPILHSYVNYPNLSCFAFGGLAAYCMQRWERLPTIDPIVMSAIVIGLLLCLCLASYEMPSFTWRFIAFPIFIAVLYGYSFMGMLVSKSWRLLGTVSYSIYLIHGTVLYLVLGFIDRVWPINSLTGAQTLAALLCCAFVVLVISSITYRLIEHPFMRHYAEKKSAAESSPNSPPSAVHRVNLSNDRTVASSG